jgi:FG-GAP repeat
MRTLTRASSHAGTRPVAEHGSRVPRRPWKRTLFVAALGSLASFARAQILDQKVFPFDGTSSAYFGDTVQLLPGWAICAAPNDHTVQFWSGAVYVFQDTPTGWKMTQKLKAPEPEQDAYFGTGLAADGEWMVVTCPNDDLPGFVNKGSAEVYHLENGVWVHTQTILASDFTAPYQTAFGTCAAVQGDRMLIGAALDGEAANTAGAVYVFERSGSTWREVAKLHASDPHPYDEFGHALNLDGDTLVVGAWMQFSTVSNRGAAYVFERAGGSWVETQKLASDHPTDWDYFGTSVAIDGDTILVGSNHDHGSLSNQGAAFVFERQAPGWTLTQELLAGDPSNFAFFGRRVDLAGDLALACSHFDADLGVASGSAYLFRRLSGGTWLQVEKLLAPDAAADRQFGSDVALCGTRALVGSRCDSNLAFCAGSAYVLDLAPDSVQYGSCPTQGPCGNDDDFGGCLNSTGQGGVLSAAGSSSVSADDLRLEARWLPVNKNALLIMGGLATTAPFADGQLCVASGGLGVWRFNPPRSTGAQGFVLYEPVVGLSNALPPGGHIQSGQIWHFQVWYRDPAGPCAHGSNLTNAVRVMFGP